MAEEKDGNPRRDGERGKDGKPSTDDLIRAQQETLHALLKQKADEETRAREEEERNLTPEQRIMRAVNRRLEHMDSQIVRLGGHSYKLYE